MQLVYIHHSGFALEAHKACLLFDYFEDSDNNYVTNMLHNFDGRIYVLCSHFHPDHFNRDVLKWTTIHPNIRYILSKDILRHRCARKEDGNYMVKGDVWNDDRISVQAFGSTDSGISFGVKIDGQQVFHAGDLNNWHWRNESTEAESTYAEKQFLAEVHYISKRMSACDLCMFPVDPRQGTEYIRGAQQFVAHIKVRNFVPMHFWGDFGAANAAKTLIAPHVESYIELHHKGEVIAF